jgi:hypothetical protein
MDIYFGNDDASVKGKEIDASSFPKYMSILQGIIKAQLN